MLQSLAGTCSNLIINQLSAVEIYSRNCPMVLLLIINVSVTNDLVISKIFSVSHMCQTCVCTSMFHWLIECTSLNIYLSGSLVTLIPNNCYRSWNRTAIQSFVRNFVDILYAVVLYLATAPVLYVQRNWGALAQSLPISYKIGMLHNLSLYM